jgi:hypothetical protein
MADVTVELPANSTLVDHQNMKSEQPINAALLSAVIVKVNEEKDVLVNSRVE